MAGIYVHVPFCKQACNYCNFHFSTSLQNKHAMVQAMAKEIEIIGSQNSQANNHTIETIYFGGGTPSILQMQEIEQLLTNIYSAFTVSSNAEVTLEANPDDINIAALLHWKKIGINRLSVGIQSFNQAELQWMNRAHTAEESLHCIDLIRKAGFTNFSIDLIYGSPLLTNEDWLKNVYTIIDKKVPHISCYALTVEPKTALYNQIKKQQTATVDGEKQADQFLLLMDIMEQQGYNHYEISNYCLLGFESKHNSSYWQNKPYFAIGPSAHSFDGKTRRWNVANNALYMAALQKDTIPYEEEQLTNTEILHEYIMTSLRTKQGLDVEHVFKNFGAAVAQIITQKSKQWILEEKMILDDHYLKLTKQGKLFADGIAVDFFE